MTETTKPTPADVAARFAENVKAAVKPADWISLRSRNNYEADGRCASTDFCDSPSIMAKTLESLGADPADAVLWNLSWDIAKRDHLTAVSKKGG